MFFSVLNLILFLQFSNLVFSQVAQPLILQLLPCNPSSWRQQWILPPNSFYEITLKQNLSYCLDTQNYGTGDGTVSWTWLCHPYDPSANHQSQNWTYKNNQLINIKSGRCLDAQKYGKAITGMELQIFTCNSNSQYQMWNYDSSDFSLKNAAFPNLCLDALGYAPPCSTAPTKSLPFCNISLSFEERVKDMLPRMSLTEKIGLLGNNAFSVASLQLPAYQWWNEALHGVGNSPGVVFTDPLPFATSFPQIIGTAASFDRTLWNQIGTVISTEARAFANIGHSGLTFWTPNINIFRDPRWGRGQETPGEDPYVNSEYSVSFVTGLQEGEDVKYLKVSACCKHYAAYSLENSDGVDRHHFDGNVTDQDWADTYLPQFQSCVQRAKGSIMCSYNSNNGIPSCADHHLLTDHIRTEWGFTGYVTGDCGAVSDVQVTHNYTHNTQDTCQAVLSAGLNSDCGSYLQEYLLDAVNTSKTVTESEIDDRLTDLFLVQMRLGIFDPPEVQVYRQIATSAVNTPENQLLALQAARESIILLKNNGSTLPFYRTTIKTIAVIGPNADAAVTLQGNYVGNAPFLITPLKGISMYANVTYAQGCTIAGTDTSGFSNAVNIAANADATVIVVGLDQTQEKEGLDRTIISFPGVQSDLISQVSMKAKGPVIVVVMAGSSVDLNAVAISPDVDAILFVGYPGQSGGQAIAEVLYGDYNPAGRTVFTTYYSDYANEVLMTDMGMRPNKTTNNPGRTYRFYENKVVYEFGSGLSYTNFTYEWILTEASKELEFKSLELILNRTQGNFFPSYEVQDLADVISVRVTNTGQMIGDDVVLAFVVPPNPGQDGAPIKSLIGFNRINLYPGQSEILSFEVPAQNLALADLSGQFRPKVGEWKYIIGVGANSITKAINVSNKI